ncbi:hypothetical protein WN944_015127 [Citrus x changshan-huyou]|uniref:Uncharacterized protein n=1 Tax=Citrus x changshan-huyou TaxID=2935761 RepID=A0AAP0M9M4_9ROSI
MQYEMLKNENDSFSRNTKNCEQTHFTRFCFWKTENAKTKPVPNPPCLKS